MLCSKYLASTTSHPQRALTVLPFTFSKGVDAISVGYSLSDVLERRYQIQLALEDALMELMLHAEQQGLAELGDNVRGVEDDWREHRAHQAGGWPNLNGERELNSNCRRDFSSVRLKDLFILFR